MALKHIGRYEILDELGRGAMGIVYKARDPLLDRTVALKTVPLDLSNEEAEAFERRFYREARSAGRLNHSNIVTVHDVGNSDSVAYIAMEFLQGRSLRQILDSGVVLPIDQIVSIVCQVADGLSFAHENGIVHRDIKPPNIMVLDNGGVKITDFGIALLPTGARTLAGTIFGSPKYMAPEQVVGRHVDGQADVFSLGAVLYEMLTGFAPFFGGDLEALLYQVINEMPASPTSRNKALPVVFDYIVAKALAKHPADRYRDARSFARDLRNFRDLRPPVDPPQELRTLERRAVRRRKGEIAKDANVAAVAPKREATANAAAESASALKLAAESEHSASPPSVTATAASVHRVRKALLVGVPAAILLFAGVGVLLHFVASGVRRDEPAPKTLPVEPLTRAIADSSATPGAPGDAVPRSASLELEAASSVSATISAPEALRGTDKPAARAAARVALAVSPWGEVYVDGKKRGLSPPMTELKLSPGKHTIEIRNTTFAPYAQTLNVDANASIKIKHKFR